MDNVEMKTATYKLNFDELITKFLSNDKDTNV